MQSSYKTQNVVDSRRKIVFDDMIVNILSKKLNPIKTKLLIRGTKLDTSLVFITQSYFPIPKNILSSTHFFIIKVPNKPKLQQITFNHSSAIGFIII